MSDLIAIAGPGEAAARRVPARVADAVEGVGRCRGCGVIACDDDGRMLPLLGSWEVGFAAATTWCDGGRIDRARLVAISGARRE